MVLKLVISEVEGLLEPVSENLTLSKWVEIGI